MTVAEAGPGPLQVRGGVGGVAVRTEDLEQAADALTEAGSGLAAVSVRLAAVAADPLLLATAACGPASLAAAEARLARALVGPSGALRAGARLEVLALRLRAAAIAYRVADEGAERLAHELTTTAALLAGTLAVRLLPIAVPAIPLGAAAAVPFRGVLIRPVAATAGGVLAGRAGALERAVDGMPGGVRQAARAILAVDRVSPLLRDAGRLVVSASEREGVPPAGTADILSAIAACYPEIGGRPGTVRVEAVRGADGRRAWVLEIPGTQDWSPVPGPNPFDLTADLTSMAGRHGAAERTATTALELAGARPDEPVLLAGHSLGGMLAAGLACDPAFRARFRVTHVLTAGSPIAGYPIPPGVQVLSLEHTDDVVPALDGRANPDRAGWVTVRQSLSTSRLTAEPVLTHGVEGYRATAALVDASPDPSLRAWRAGLAPFLGRPGATTRELVVSARREPP